MKKIIFSVDLEDWYQGLEIDASSWSGFEPRVEIGLRVVLDLLEAAQASATFFVLGYQAEQRPDLVRLVAERSHEIASHGYAHRLIYQQSPAEFRDDIRRARDILEQLVGTRVAGYRAPFFSITSRSSWALDILAEEGFAYDSSVFPVLNYRYGMPGAKREPHWITTRSGGRIFEMPLTTVALRAPFLRKGFNVPAGGGAYFRLYPYLVTRFLLARAARSEHPPVFYVHPWEYDPEHPRMRLPRRIAQFTHYVNLGSTVPKTRRLLSEFSGTTASAAYESVLRARPSPRA